MNVAVFNKILFAKTNCGLDLLVGHSLLTPGVYRILWTTALDLEIVVYYFC